MNYQQRRKARLSKKKITDLNRRGRKGGKPCMWGKKSKKVKKEKKMIHKPLIK